MPELPSNREAFIGRFSLIHLRPVVGVSDLLHAACCCPPGKGFVCIAIIFFNRHTLYFVASVCNTFVSYKYICIGSKASQTQQPASPPQKNSVILHYAGATRNLSRKLQLHWQTYFPVQRLQVSVSFALLCASLRICSGSGSGQRLDWWCNRVTVSDARAALLDYLPSHSGIIGCNLRNLVGRIICFAVL
jgi:hypothetical protein